MKNIPRQKYIRLLFVIGILILLNFFLLSLIPEQIIVNLDGTTVRQSEMTAVQLQMLFVSIPLMSFLLALFLSFIPYKKLKWSKKYLFFTLNIMAGIQILLCLSSIIKLF